jgi:hypothetical protein
MNRATDPLSSMLKATAVAAQRYAALSLEETESLLKCQIGVTRELFSIAGKQLAQWSSESPSSIASMDWSPLFRVNAERAAELTRACLDAAAKTQDEFARLSQEQVSVLSKMWLENVRGITTAAEAAGIVGVEPLERKHKKAA